MSLADLAARDMLAHDWEVILYRNGRPIETSSATARISDGSVLLAATFSGRQRADMVVVTADGEVQHRRDLDLPADVLLNSYDLEIPVTAG